MINSLGRLLKLNLFAKYLHFLAKFSNIKNGCKMDCHQLEFQYLGKENKPYQICFLKFLLKEIKNILEFVLRMRQFIKLKQKIISYCKILSRIIWYLRYVRNGKLSKYLRIRKDSN
jgi:hypothetical protein